MAKKRSVHKELGDLQAELNRPAAPDEPPPEPAVEPLGEIETLLRDLESSLGKAGEEAEELVARHPLAAISAAFLLGIFAGRMVGR